MNNLQEFSGMNSSVIKDFSTNSKVLLITFGGIYGGSGIPVFEFFNMASQFSVNKMFIRDLNQAWYQKGIKNPDIKNIDGMVTFLKHKIQESNAQKVVMVGNSAGGFAALLFGNLLNVDVVHSFAPQTFIDRKNRTLHSDTRWFKQISELYNDDSLTEDYFDLYKVFDKNKTNTKTQYHIYYDGNHKLDRIHSERLGKFHNIKLFKYIDGGHNVIKHMKENGDLLELLKQSLET